MEYTHLGRSGLSVSRLCLGTMNFGPLTLPADAHAIMNHAHEIGVNFFDDLFPGYRPAPEHYAW
jgi:aryl-alcohol dehydrogenase-like predicted oxidoreductase